MVDRISLNGAGEVVPFTNTSNLAPDGTGSFRVGQNSGTYSVKAGGNDVGFEHTGSFNVANTSNGESGILASAKHLGRPVGGANITGDATVIIDGIECRVDTAVATGLLIRNADGSYSEPSQASKAEPERQQTNNQEPGEFLSRDVESVIDAFNADVPSNVILSAVNDIANGNDFNQATLDDTASRLGMEPSELAECAGDIRAAFETQARQAVTASGVDADCLFDWAWENRPDLMQSAIKRHATERTTAGYKAIAAEYIGNLDTIDPDAILNAQFGPGITADRTSAGAIVLNTPHGQIAYRQAVKAGIIRIRGRA